MSLRYLDINPTPISEDEIYGIDKVEADSQQMVVKYLLNKVEQYEGGSLTNTINTNVFSEGFHSLGCPLVSCFYNSLFKKTFFMSGGGEREYEYDNPIFTFQNMIYGGAEDSSLISQYVDKFSNFLIITVEQKFYYIGKKDNKICKLVLEGSDSTITEYNGQKINSITDLDIFYVFDVQRLFIDMKGENVIFKVGRYLYRYDIYEDFIDDNIILWGILPEEIDNLSLNSDSIQNGPEESFYKGFILTDFVNHRYYTATLTDTPPTPTPTPTLYTIRFLNYDGTLLESKEVEEGITPAYTGQTPTREGYTFTGWNPALYPADKNQDYIAEFKQNARDVTINYKLSNSEEVFYTSKISSITNPITKIEIDTTLTFDVTFYTSDGRDYGTYYSGSVGGKDVLPYIESYKYGENTYLANKFNNIPTEISTNDTTEEITIIFNVGDDYHYKIQFLNRSVSPNVLHQVQRLLEGETPVFSGKTQPSKEGYNFVGWNPTPYPVNKNQDYVAVFEIVKTPYAITLEDSSNEPFTSTPTSITFNNQLTRILFNNDLFGNPYIYYVDIDGEHTINITYTNKGGGFTRITLESIEINGETYSDLNTWVDLNISSAVIITLNSVVYYYIQFKDDDGFSLYSYWCLKGSTPVYGGSTPSKTGYDFIGWTPALYPADKTQVYTATYKIKTFTIRFLDDDGSVLETKNVNYGETPTYTGETPTKEGYTFNGWSPTLYPANKNQDYTATYRNNAFAVTLYKCTAENNRIDKTDYLTSVGELVGYLREETSIINPVIVIEYDKVIDFNYVYISTFNRYYFVTEVKNFRTNLWRISLRCDVLMTYKETILNYECYVSRNEFTFDSYIEDNLLPLKHDKQVEITKKKQSSGSGTDFFKGYSAVFTALVGTISGLSEDVETELTTLFDDDDGNPATISTFAMGSSSFKTVQIIPDVGHYQEALTKIADEIIIDDRASSYILTLIVFPIWNVAFYDEVGSVTKNQFYYSNKSIDLGEGSNIILKADTIVPIFICSFAVNGKHHSYLDYEPYSNYEVWLPFYGWATLPSVLVVDKVLAVYYCIQPDSTKGTIIVKNNSDNYVVLQVDCTIGVEVALNSSDSVETRNRGIQAGVNMNTQMLTGLALAGASAVVPFGGAALFASGLGAMVSGFANGITNIATLRDRGNGRVTDGNAGNYSDRNVRLKITYPEIAVDDMTKYAKYVGRPLQTNVKLNTLTGFTIVGAVHVEDLGVATDTEKQEIETQLKKGVII